ncbi:MAG: transcription antitermination factor NusB, partial [Candidatus Omnitrophica bacterium]|nr:transcription antitermination factor NusB [Candidatus Omnitrophota bacterium]
MRKRSLAREHALKILYQAEIIKRDIPFTFDQYWHDKGESDETVLSFAKFLTMGVEKNCPDIDEKISKYATNWQLKRMAVIDRNVLRLGVFELLYAEEIPPKVSINESVELAKKYGDLESSK